MPTKKVHLQYEDFRRIKKGEPFYSPSKRWYISESTGLVISKSTFQRRATRVETEVPEKPKKHRISTVSKRSNYHDKLQRYVNVVNEKEEKVGGNKFITMNEARQTAEFKLYYKWLKTKDNSKNGKKARALVAFGLRDEDADYDVGDTP